MYIEKITNRKYFISFDDGKNFVVSKDMLSLHSVLLNKKSRQNEFIERYSKMNRYTFTSPSLHIVVVTNRCNHLCKYCRATNSNIPMADMDLRTAYKVIDFIFSIPNKSLVIEFQGGEPLLNWKTIKETVLYVKSKNEKEKKDVVLSLVTNLSLMDDEKLKFLVENNVSICTSFDGPAKLHNLNRKYTGGDSYFITKSWFKKIYMVIQRFSNGKKDSLPSALMTTTRYSFPYWKEIVDEYRSLGIGGIFIRPLSPIGYAKDMWSEIGYEPYEFLNFYEKVMDYVLLINETERFIERNAAIKLRKILFNEDPNYFDLRSPCGAVIGQLAYNPNGDIYTCDEGRMLGTMGDYTFKLGNVFVSSYKDIVCCKNAVRCIFSSVLENYPMCMRCAFKPYCGVCPVFNHVSYGKPYYHKNGSYWCMIEKGIFRILVKKLMIKKYREIFSRWFYA